MNINTEITINASKEKVWNILTNFSEYKNWNPFIIMSEGTLKKGSKLKNTMINGKGTMKFSPKILNVDNYKYFDWLGHLFFKGIFDGHHYFKIEEIKPGQIKMIQGENFSGLLSKIIMKKIGEQTRQNFIKMNDALKEKAEKEMAEQLV